MIRVDSIESTRIDDIFNPPSKSRSNVFFKSRANRLPACRIDRKGNDLCRFDGIGFTNRFPVYDSTRFSRSRSALPEVKIREIMIHEPSSFLKRGNKLKSIRLQYGGFEVRDYLGSLKQRLAETEAFISNSTEGDGNLETKLTLKEQLKMNYSISSQYEKRVEVAMFRPKLPWTKQEGEPTKYFFFQYGGKK